MNAIIKDIESEHLRSDIPNFHIGDTICVYVKILEGSRERVQMFEGAVIKRQNGGLRESFTVRRFAHGIGVEKTWPLHSPKIEKIVVVRRGRVRRAKLYYLRERIGKSAKIKEIITKKIPTNRCSPR
jgi:large subunit ribosomal protein L19